MTEAGCSSTSFFFNRTGFIFGAWLWKPSSKQKADRVLCSCLLYKLENYIIPSIFHLRKYSNYIMPLLYFLYSKKILEEWGGFWGEGLVCLFFYSWEQVIVLERQWVLWVEILILLLYLTRILWFCSWLWKLGVEGRRKPKQEHSWRSHISTFVHSYLGIAELIELADQQKYHVPHVALNTSWNGRIATEKLWAGFWWSGTSAVLRDTLNYPHFQNISVVLMWIKYCSIIRGIV